MNSEPIVIKKYPNRRLYDTSDSRYINLEDIGELIRKGKDVQVVDAQTGEDLTRVTLTQIIVDDAKQQPTGLPLELLRQLIMSSDQVGREFIMWYLKSAYEAYQNVQTKLHSGLTEMQTAAVSPISMIKSFIQGQRPESLVPVSQVPVSPTDSNAELHQLRQRIAELEARVEKPKPAKAPAKAKAPGRAKVPAERKSTKK